MGIATELKRSQKHLERALGHPTFTWYETTYPCTATSETKSKDLEPGGFSPDADLVLFVRAELFPTDEMPQPKEKIIYRGSVYRIADVVNLPGNGQFKLVCMAANRGA